MAINNPEELFLWLLSDVRQREERVKGIFQEMSKAVEDPDVKETLDSRIFLVDQIVSKLDQVFKIIGKQPIKISDRIHDVFVEDFRRELAEIKTPMVKGLYIAAKASHLMHFTMGEYVALTAMADITGHYGVGQLLESCLADNMAFAERARRRIRKAVVGAAEAAMERAGV